MTGKVTFVGAGCGDPRLLTVRGAEVLATADYVLFDVDVHPDVLSRLREGTPRHRVELSMTAEYVATLLATEAKQGKSVVRLVWGDPMLFGWGDVEGAAVARQGVALEIVPGIVPFVAVGAFAGVPLARSGDVSSSVAVVSVTSGHEMLHDWAKLATATDTLAIVCDADSIAETARSIVFGGGTVRTPSDRVTLVENVSLPSQRVIETTLGEVPQLPRSTSARIVLVVGPRAAPERELSWFTKGPLFGKRVLVTRAREQAGSAASLLRERGADPLVVPTIEIHPPSDPSSLIDAVQAMDRYDWVVLTSANGVDRLWAEMRRQGRDARAFGNAKIAAIGPGTAAALERCGLIADLVAKEHRQEALAVEVAATPLPHPARVLLARAEVARDALPTALRDAGCLVDDVAVYKTRSPPRALLEALSALLEAGEIDVVTFTSSSTVDHLCDALEARAATLLAKTCVASIGPITTETAEKRGIRVDVTAAQYTVLGLVVSLEKYFAK